MKIIPGFSRYAINNNGEIFSTNYKNSGKIKKLSPAKDVDGYLKTMLLGDNGVYKSKCVHSFVALTYLGKRPLGLEINHIDGDKLNNKPSNLEYISHRENVQHAFDNGLMEAKIGSDNGMAKLTEADVIEIRKIASQRRNYGRKQLAERFNVSEGHIKDIV